MTGPASPRTWRVRAEHEADGRTYLLDGEYTTAEEAQRVATEMYGGFDDVDYWAEEEQR